MSSDESSVLEALNRLRPEVNFVAASDLVAEGFLDSFDIVSLISDLESRFAVRIDGAQIVPEHFQNIATIASLVHRSEIRS